MQRYTNRPRRPKAKAAADPDAWHEWLTRALIMALIIFIASQLLLAGLGSQAAIASVGDRIMLNPGTICFGGVPVIPATTRDGASVRRCRLDIAAMKHAGGVLNVLQAGPDGITLSWAGGPTATGAASCKGREIVVSAHDYMILLKAGPKNINAR
jgi:hypothetical protein